MTRAIMALSGSAAALLPRPFAGLAHLLDGFWHELTRHHLFDGYRPERHYMRGPGPACQAKYGDPQRQSPAS